MIKDLQHGMTIKPTRDEQSRQAFVGSLRAHILGPMAEGMKQHYEERLVPAFRRRTGRDPVDGEEVHDLMQAEDCFRLYSSVRYNAQEMVHNSVIPTVERQLDELNERGRQIRKDGKSPIALNPDFETPKNVASIDVHLTPGSYHTEFAEDDVAQGAIYDNSINVFAFNQMGRNVDDIGTTMSNYIRLKFPEFKPERILDCGCTVGHNTVPWKLTYPQADVHGIDVSAPVLRYAAARSRGFGADVNFHQMSATSLDFPDNHFDVVFSSMFLHELPLKDIRAYLAEAHRVLKPGGLLITMELPPNSNLEAYDQFYLDWDSYYNNEPYYKPYRDQSNKELCRQAGFDANEYFEFQTPRYTYMDEADYIREINTEARFTDRSGTLTEGLRWFAFGNWKK